MLTMEILRKLPPHSIFAAGVFRDIVDTDGISVTGDYARLLKWVAVRGEIADWGVYAGDLDVDPNEIKLYGLKIRIDSATILVECDTEAEHAYRS